MPFKALWLLDTYWFITHREKKDPLEDPEWAKWYAQKITGRELSEGAEELLSALFALRISLAKIVAELQEGIFSEEEVIKLLNPYLMSSAVKRKILSNDSSSPTLDFVPEQADVPYVMAELALAWYKLLFENDRSRIRICENPDCACYFYDESKNKSKRHCAPNCSNVMKVRRHREKNAPSKK